MSAPSGWYPDPGGEADLYRFWDGSTWSVGTSTDPASPPPGTPGPTVGVPGRFGTRAAGAAPHRSGARWFLAAAALLVVIVVLAALILRRGGDEPVTGPTPGSPSSAAASCPDAAVPTAAPPAQGDRVTSGRLSYPRLAAPFSAPRWDRRVPFGRDVQNQDAVVETAEAGGSTWVSAVLIARLLAGDGFFGPEQGARVVADCVVARFYGDAPVQRADRRDTAITVDGHQAWLIESHLSFRLPGIETTGETMIVVVVDTGEGEAGLFYGSVPDTAPQFLRPTRRALAQLDVS